MKEVWKPVEKFYGYEVSSKGRVRSINRMGHKTSRKHTDNSYKQEGQLFHKQGLILALVLSSSGNRKDAIRVTVNLFIHGKNTSRGVARLVYEAFIGKLSTHQYVYHIDGDRSEEHTSELQS